MSTEGQAGLTQTIIGKIVTAKQAERKSYHDVHSKDCEFIVGQTVLAQNIQGEPRWLKGTVIAKAGPVSYKVQVGDRVWKRHVDQLLSAESDSREQTFSDDFVHTSVQTNVHRMTSHILQKRTLILKQQPGRFEHHRTSRN